MHSIARKVRAITLCSLLLTTAVYAKVVTDWPAIKAELDAMLKADQTLRLESNEMLADARARRESTLIKSHKSRFGRKSTFKIARIKSA